MPLLHVENQSRGGDPGEKIPYGLQVSAVGSVCRCHVGTSKKLAVTRDMREFVLSSRGIPLASCLADRRVPRHPQDDVTSLRQVSPFAKCVAKVWIGQKLPNSKDQIRPYSRSRHALGTGHFTSCSSPVLHLQPAVSGQHIREQLLGKLHCDTRCRAGLARCATEGSFAGKPCDLAVIPFRTAYQVLPCPRSNRRRPDGR